MLWLVAADLVTLIHAGYVAFVIIGFVAILVGWEAQRHWVRNLYFRLVHLALILFVCRLRLVESIWQELLDYLIRHSLFARGSVHTR